MRAAGDRHVAKLDGSIGERACDRDQVATNYRVRALQLQNERGVQNVLSGRAKMDVARGFVARDSAEFLHNRDDRIADATRAFRDVIEPHVLDPSRAADRIGRVHRNQTKLRFRAGERSLDIEHELQMSIVRKQLPDFIGAIERSKNLRVCRMNAHTSKNTVSFSPCSTISNRKMPG